MKTVVLAWLIVLLLLSACSQESQSLPTLAPSATAPTEAELEASETPVDVPTNTSAPRPTLPPTWTPASAMTSTPLPTIPPPASPTPDPSIPTVVLPTRPPSCDSFGPDLSLLSRVYAEDQDVTVYWVDIPEAEFYNIVLLDDSGQQVMADYAAGSSYVFPADRFDYGRIYGWEATPINALGQQICVARGAELVPEVFTTVD